MTTNDARNEPRPGPEKASTSRSAAPGGAPVAEQQARVRAALAGTRFGDVRWVAATGSTNADVLVLARDGAPEGVVVTADHQSAGRGRQARPWLAPPGSALLVSVLLRPRAAVAGAATMVVAVAMAEAVEQVAGVSPELKWPNDLVVGERKLAGILAEADWPAGTTIAAGYRKPPDHERVTVVVGIGVNVIWPGSVEAAPEELPVEVADRGTALNWLGADVDRAELLIAFLRCLDRHYRELVSDGPASLRAEWRRRSATLGRRVRIELGADDVEGTAFDISDEGHLVVDTLDGELRTFAVGDVVHLRPLSGPAG